MIVRVIAAPTTTAPTAILPSSTAPATRYEPCSATARATACGAGNTYALPTAYAVTLHKDNRKSAVRIVATAVEAPKRDLCSGVISEGGKFNETMRSEIQPDRSSRNC